MTEENKTAIKQNAVAATKPGVFTSEFWVMVATQIFVTLGVSVIEALGMTVSVEQIAAVVVTAMTYITGRTINKGQILSALKKVEPAKADPANA